LAIGANYFSEMGRGMGTTSPSISEGAYAPVRWDKSRGEEKRKKRKL